MVRQDGSEFWTKYGKGPLAGELVAAEAEAKAMGGGVWKNKGR